MVALSNRLVAAIPVFLSAVTFFVTASAGAIGQATAVNEWTWLGGSQEPPPQTLGPYAIYGTKGVPAAANTPGGRRDYQSWRDEQGNFWLFGGFAQPDDLWKLDGASGQWTWVAGPNTVACPSNPCAQWPAYGTVGVPDPTTNPGNREFPTTFTANDGTLWLFGGFGKDARQEPGALNDLWRYDPANGAWTWVSGTSELTCSLSPLIECGQSPVLGTKGVAAKTNTPGATQQAAGWATSDGKLWLYGGGTAENQGNPGTPNLLWSFDIATGMWTWLSGKPIGNGDSIPATYGTKGVASPSNDPGSRSQSETWVDHAGHLWLFSGNLQPNDMWEYDPASNEWTWVSGEDGTACNGLGCPGVYGTQGVAAPDNTPGTHVGAATWTAMDGTLWMYGGVGDDGAGAAFSGVYETYLNDLWQFDPATRQWTWIDGPSIQPCSQTTNYCSTPATFGVQGTPDPANTPGGRTISGGWLDLKGNLRLFGGDYFFGIQIASELVLDASMDDSWVYQPSSAFATVTPAPKVSLPSGSYSGTQSVTVTDASSGAAIYYTTDGTTPTESSEHYSGPIQLSQNTVLKAIAVANAAAPSAVTQATYVLQWSFSLAMGAGSPATVNIPVGDSGNFSMAVNPILGSSFPSSVSFSVSGLPQGATATFNPSTLSKGSSRSIVTLSVQTRGATAMRSYSSASLVLCFVCLPFLLIRSRRSGAFRVLLWGWLLVLTLSATSACGGGRSGSGGGGGPTPTGTYPLTVSASCGQSQATIIVTAQVE
jgi:N-acetylneuraminic acid mutarotase